MWKEQGVLIRSTAPRHDSGRVEGNAWGKSEHDRICVRRRKGRECVTPLETPVSVAEAKRKTRVYGQGVVKAARKLHIVF